MNSNSVQKKRIKITKSPQKIEQVVVSGQTELNIPISPRTQISENKLGSMINLQGVQQLQNVKINIYGGLYEGTVLNGNLHGQGIFKTQAGKIVYQGNWQDNHRSGFGRYFYPDGSIYQGNWNRNFKVGQGIYINNFGQKFQGYWMENKRHGNGKLQLKDGTNIQGTWQQGELISGRIRYPSQGYYQGQIKNMCRHGKGVYYYPNGDKYKGQWVNNMKMGAGSYQFKNGDTYTGNFKDNFRDGTDCSYRWPSQCYQMTNGVFKTDQYIKGNIFKTK